MDRRELIKQIALLTGGIVIGSEVFLTGCKSGGSTEIGFTPANISLLDEVGETILPATSTSPGAKAAKIGEFMKTIVTDCYEEKEQTIFNEGIGKLEQACKKATGKSFMECSAEERTKFLIELDTEAKAHQKKKTDFDNAEVEIQKREKAQGVKYEKKKMDAHYFTMMKQLTVWGYFTSKEGLTKALRFNPVPGKYEGCVDYKKGDKLQAGLGG
jgi:hypothetical protein